MDLTIGTLQNFLKIQTFFNILNISILVFKFSLSTKLKAVLIALLFSSNFFFQQNWKKKKKSFPTIKLTNMKNKEKEKN